jgi:predicted ATP-binding protein involved in virulence
MRVTELKIKNFRGIKDLHLMFNSEHNVVVLVGINGIGKSSVLNCINLLVKYYDLVLRGKTHRRMSGSPILQTFIQKSDIRIGSSNSINQIKVNFGVQDITWEIDAVSWPRNLNRMRRMQGLSNIQTNAINVHNNTDISLGHFYFYYLANRQLKSFQKNNVDELDEIINFENFSKWFKETEDLENEQRLSDSIDYRHPVLSAVRNAVCSFLGEGYNSLTFKRKFDKVTIKKLGVEISIDLLSDGEKSLLAMVGDLSKRLAESDQHLEASALVLIDEIELHLHPAWQRMIIPRLTKTFPNCQFIVTTHSPQVLSHVDPECIHILDYDGDNVIVKRPESSYGLDSNRILEDILGVSKRPQEIQERMLELFRTINNNDLASAKEIVRELGDRIGINEPELVKAEATIKRREIIGR